MLSFCHFVSLFCLHNLFLELSLVSCSWLQGIKMQNFASLFLTIVLFLVKKYFLVIYNVYVHSFAENDFVYQKCFANIFNETY